jgi:hypothetical protein
MVVGQSRNRRHLIGTSISKSFLVFYRLTSFNFASLLDRYGKADPGRNLRLVRASLSSRCCWIATAKLSSLFVSFVPLFRLAAAGSLRQSCPAFSYCSCLPFRLADAGSLRQSCPAHYHRPSFNFRFDFFCWIATAKLSSFNLRSFITN